MNARSPIAAARAEQTAREKRQREEADRAEQQEKLRQENERAAAERKRLADLRAAAEARPHTEDYTHTGGTGSVLQLIGTVIILTGLFAETKTTTGAVIGGVLLISFGAHYKKRTRCSACKNPVTNNEVRTCPTCRADLTP